MHIKKKLEVCFPYYTVYTRNNTWKQQTHNWTKNKNKLSKQLEQKQIHKNGDHMEGYELEGGERENGTKGTGNKKYKW